MPRGSARRTPTFVVQRNGQRLLCLRCGGATSNFDDVRLRRCPWCGWHEIEEDLEPALAVAILLDRAARYASGYGPLHYLCPELVRLRERAEAELVVESLRDGQDGRG